MAEWFALDWSWIFNFFSNRGKLEWCDNMHQRQSLILKPVMLQCCLLQCQQHPGGFYFYCSPYHQCEQHHKILPINVVQTNWVNSNSSAFNCEQSKHDFKVVNLTACCLMLTQLWECRGKQANCQMKCHCLVSETKSKQSSSYHFLLRYDSALRVLLHFRAQTCSDWWDAVGSRARLRALFYL